MNHSRNTARTPVRAQMRVVELKAVNELTADHEAQLFNYLRIAEQPVGYLINFGHKEDLQWKRFILTDLRRRTGGQEGKEH